ncbi:MAG: o-succinylbenzoate synthase [Myxococcota bacterium]|nr:o-succinylbenzoate synthase [Myxococcota bacterium]
MRIVRAELIPIRAPLRVPLDTAHGPIRERLGAVVALTEAGGARGFGEALPLAGFGLESAREARRALERAIRALVGARFESLDAALDGVLRATPGAPSARAALDVALHDLAARAREVPVAALLAGVPASPRTRIPVAALVAGATPETVGESAARALARGHATFKLKVGALAAAADRARARALRDRVGAGAALRLDANGAWDAQSAPLQLSALAEVEPEYVEQPVAADEIEALARLRAVAPVPVAADEAVRDEAHAARLLACGAADVLVVKPAAVGGLRPAWRIAARARAAGAGVVVTGFLDTALGSAAALHLAAALPGPPRAAGLATDGLLACDLAALPPVRDGARALPRGSGLGVDPDWPALASGRGAEIAA